MSTLSPEQIAAVRQLRLICDNLRTDMAIIGAMAYRIWVQDTYRQTQDVDTAVAIDLDDLPRLTMRLGAEGWERDPRVEHRWNTPQGARIDLIPAGPALRRQRYLDWPSSGMRMSLVGFEHVFKDAVNCPIAPDLTLKVIPLPVLALLKIVAYLDNPHARERDIQDLAALLMRYEPDDSQRFGEDVLAAGLEYDAVPAYLIGKEVGMLCSPDERVLVSRFLNQLGDPDGRPFHTFSRAVAGDFDATRETKARSIVDAFNLGFQTQRGP
jgi:predicted nucleotidyltransferase